MSKTNKIEIHGDMTAALEGSRRFIEAAEENFWILPGHIDIEVAPSRYDLPEQKTFRITYVNREEPSGKAIVSITVKDGRLIEPLLSVIASMGYLEQQYEGEFLEDGSVAFWMVPEEPQREMY